MNLDKKAIFLNLSRHANALAKDFQSSNNSIVLKYEDLILDMKGSLKLIFDYIGTNVDETLLDELIKRFNNISNKNIIKHKTTNAADSVIRWKNELKNREIDNLDEFNRLYKDVFSY